MSFPDHFSDVSSAYAEYRPRYPDSLFAWLAELPAGRDLAWDCATGSGQAAIGLASRFERVIGTDASAGQIAAAVPDPRVDYRVAPAEESGLDSESVDLVTVAQALHWLDRPAFFAEARRVLRRGGAIAAWTYGNPRLDDARSDEVLRRFTSETVGPYWPPERALVDAEYRTIDFPFAELDPPAFEMDARWPLAALLGYIGTWSATTRFRAARGYDPLPELTAQLQPFWGDPETPRRIDWPLALRAGRREAIRKVSE
ncbi:MAG TPA: class I SAM-dependent methyltransferase [Thermoanaerobaculia bacterium]